MVNFDKFSSYIIIPIIVVFIVFFICFYSIEETGGNENIWIEAEDADIITKGFDIIKDIDASNGMAVANRLPSHQAGAFVSYKFNIRSSGKYFIWLRTLWAGGCNNTFKISLDKSKKIIIGNDNLFDKWHWIQQCEYELTRGEHGVTVYNEESRTGLDKILLTSNPYYVPSGFGASSDFNINFSDGIPDFMQTKIIDFCEINTEEGINTMFIKPLDKDHKILFDKENDEKFDFEIVLKFNGPIEKRNFGILFNFIDNNNYEKVEIGNHAIKHVQLFKGKETIQKIEHSDSGYISHGNMIFNLLYTNPDVKLKIDRKTVLRSVVGQYEKGKIGIQPNQGDLFIKSLVNTTDLSPFFYENFFWTYVRELVNGDKTNISWQVEAGDWEVDMKKSIQSMGGVIDTGKPATIILGKDYWKNYTLTVAVRLMANEAGAYFCYTDTNNYYLLKLNGMNNKLALYKSMNNNIVRLAEADYGLKYHEWYKVAVSKYKDSIYVQIDGKQLIQASDTSFTEGKVGFWSNGFPEINLFDDISIYPFEPGTREGLTHNYEYNFEKREKAGIDFCDWENSGNIFSKGPIAYINKRTLLPAAMKNKRSFKGNFKISWNTTPIPEDVNVVLKFDVRGNKTINCYEFLFLSNTIHIIKNNKTVLEREISNLNRNSIEIGFLGNKWYISSGQYNIIEMEDELQNENTIVTYGFSGIGKAGIFINEIRIEDNLVE